MQRVRAQQGGGTGSGAAPPAAAAAAAAGARQARPAHKTKRDQELYQQQQRALGQDAESRSFRRMLRFPKYQPPLVRPGEPGYEDTRAGRRERLQAELEAAFGPHHRDNDVRVYLMRRELNARRPGGRRRGGLPVDDSFERPGTFLKLSAEFQATVLRERSAALAAVLPTLGLQESWLLYTGIPGLLTLPTMDVAQRLHGLARALDLPLARLVPALRGFRRLAFLHPNTAESRVGLLAKLARLDRRRAVLLMMQHPQLWLMGSNALGPRAEELALLLGCCTVTALKLLGSCPQLLDAPLPAVQQAAAALCDLLGCQGAPWQAMPLLLWGPGLLLPQLAQQQQEQQEQQEQQALSLADLQRRLRAVEDALRLPADVVRGMALQTPDLLDLAAAGPPDGPGGEAPATAAAAAAAAAAANALEASWLCAGGASRARQQYQQRVRELLSRPQHRGRRGKQRPGQAQAAAARFLAADAAARAAVSCQWWAQAATSAGQEAQQPLPALQQLLQQAPALLVLAVAAQPVAAASATKGGEAASGGDGAGVLPASGLDQRLQLLADQLAALGAHGEGGAQQQQLAGLRQQVAVTAVLEPGLLSQPPAFVASQLAQLARLLGTDVPRAWQLAAASCPGVLWLTGPQGYERVRTLCGTVRRPAAEVRAGLVQDADTLALLLLDPECIRAAATAAAVQRPAAGGGGGGRGAPGAAAAGALLRRLAAGARRGGQGEGDADGGP